MTVRLNNSNAGIVTLTNPSSGNAYNFAFNTQTSATLNQAMIRAYTEATSGALTFQTVPSTGGVVSAQVTAAPNATINTASITSTLTSLGGPSANVNFSPAGTGGVTVRAPSATSSAPGAYSVDMNMTISRTASTSGVPAQYSFLGNYEVSANTAVTSLQNNYTAYLNGSDSGAVPTNKGASCAIVQGRTIDFNYNTGRSYYSATICADYAALYATPATTNTGYGIAFTGIAPTTRGSAYNTTTSASTQTYGSSNDAQTIVKGNGQGRFVVCGNATTGTTITFNVPVYDIVGTTAGTGISTSMVICYVTVCDTSNNTASFKISALVVGNSNVFTGTPVVTTISNASGVFSAAIAIVASNPTKVTITRSSSSTMRGTARFVTSDIAS